MRTRRGARARYLLHKLAHADQRVGGRALERLQSRHQVGDGDRVRLGELARVTEALDEVDVAVESDLEAQLRRERLEDRNLIVHRRVHVPVVEVLEQLPAQLRRQVALFDVLEDFVELGAARLRLGVEGLDDVGHGRDDEAGESAPHSCTMIAKRRWPIVLGTISP